MSFVDPRCIDVHFFSYSILYIRECKIVFPQRECVEILTVYKIVCRANSKVNHLISPDLKKMDGHSILVLSKCCLSQNVIIFPSEKDSKSSLLIYMWKVTHLQYFQSFSP